MSIFYNYYFFIIEGHVAYVFSITDDFACCVSVSEASIVAHCESIIDIYDVIKRDENFMHHAFTEPGRIRDLRHRILKEIYGFV